MRSRRNVQVYRSEDDLVCMDVFMNGRHYNVWLKHETGSRLDDPRMYIHVVQCNDIRRELFQDTAPHVWRNVCAEIAPIARRFKRHEPIPLHKPKVHAIGDAADTVATGIGTHEIIFGTLIVGFLAIGFLSGALL